jgi:hypothetical protein
MDQLIGVRYRETHYLGELQKALGYQQAMIGRF